MAEIIKATPDDADALSRLGKDTYAETFIGVSYYTRELVEGYTKDAFAPTVIQGELRDSRVQYLLLRVDGVHAGFAKLEEREPAACIAHLQAIYLSRIYLARAFQRRGLGTLLLNAVYAEARARGHGRLWLSVWEHNAAAIAFYRRLGYHEAGEWGWEFDSGGRHYVDRDLVMTIELVNAPGAGSSGSASST